MNKERYAARREKARRLMHEAGLDALLVSLDANRFYLSGFELHDAQLNESSGCLVLVKDGRDWLCTDPRFQDAARQLWDEERLFIYRGNGLGQVNALLRERVSGSVGFEARSLSVATFETLGQGLRMEKADGLVESLRMIKEAWEIERMEASCALNHRLMEQLPALLAPGRTEVQAAWDIEQFFRNQGAEELAFPCIVGVDANAALPHAEPGLAQISENCGVLVDVGCRLHRYCSDQTRTLLVGNGPDPVLRADLERVREVQALAISQVRPGMACSELYSLVRSFFEDQGVGELFTHGLGHGIGLQTHEAPSLGATSQAVLQAGMIITIEPGLYRPGRCGARWEYMVLVTEEGARVL